MVTQHPALSVPSFRAQIDSDLDETGSCNEKRRPHFKIATYEQQRHPNKQRNHLIKVKLKNTQNKGFIN